MKIVFLTEMDFEGYVEEGHPNMRTEFAWMAALKAFHSSLHWDLEGDKNFDLGIIIPPKKGTTPIDFHHFRKYCKKIAIMQEGPYWYFQDYPLDTQINYFNLLMGADMILVHNEQDKKYFKGLTNKTKVEILPSLMLEEPIKETCPSKTRSGVMIGGNFKSWYGGFDSYQVATSVTGDIYSPTMGRRSEGEEQLLTQLPYMEWNKWITELSKRKIGVHMMRTYAAGTFALNCAYLGIPCIGYNNLDTQRRLHPMLSVDEGDLITAKKRIHKLWNDKDFYEACSETTKELYKKLYSKESFLKHFNENIR